LLVSRGAVVAVPLRLYSAYPLQSPQLSTLMHTEAAAEPVVTVSLACATINWPGYFIGTVKHER